MSRRIAIGDGSVDPDLGEVHRGSRRARLRARELALLRYLAERPGVSIGRTELYQAVWGYHPDTRSRTLDTTVRRIREVIEADPRHPVHLLTETGVGYRFEPPAVEHDLPGLHVADGVREISGERTVLWGPPGVGKSHWLRATGLPGIDDVDLAAGIAPGLSTSSVRPRILGVHAVEVKPMPPPVAASLVTARLVELGCDVPCPADLSAWDGLPAALLAAADRAATVGAFGPPGPDDPLQRRYAALVAGDGALGALAVVPGPLPADLVVEVVGQARLAAWLDRGLVRHEAGGVRALEHVRRAAVPEDGVVVALTAAIEQAFRHAHHPTLGAPVRRRDQDRARVLAPAVRDPGLAVRRAVALGLPPPEPVAREEVLPWARAGTDPERILARAEQVDHPHLQAAIRAIALRRLGRAASLEGAEPLAGDVSLEAGEWAYQRAICAAMLHRHDEALRWYRAARQGWRGCDLLEERVAGAMGQSLVLLGQLDEAVDLLTPACEVPSPEARIEARLGLAFVGLLRGEPDAVRGHARAARDLVHAATSFFAAQALVQLAVVLRDVGDSDGARAAVLQALRIAPSRVPAYVVALAHLVLATTLVDQGDLAGALVHCGEAQRPAGLAQHVARARVLAGLVLELQGRAEEGRAAVLEGIAALGDEPTRTRHLVRALAAGPIRLEQDEIDEIIAFADRTLDLPLGAVARIAAQTLGLAIEQAGEVDGRFSAEVRLARRLWIHRTKRDVRPR